VAGNTRGGGLPAEGFVFTRFSLAPGASAGGSAIIYAMAKRETLTTEDCARLAVDEASEGLGADIVLLDLRDLGVFTDYFVIASGETGRHLESLAEAIARRVREHGLRAHHREGVGNGGWILLDFPGFVVHLFTRPVRERYGLERLWGRAREVVRVQ